MGIDLALKNIGIIILTEEGHQLRHYTLTPKLRRRGKGKDAPGAEAEKVHRLINIANDIIGYAKTYKVELVGIEGFAFGRQHQAHQLGEIAGVVKTQLWLALGIVAEPVQPNTGRKHLLGYGKPSKDQVIEVVRALGVEVGQGEDDENADHEADAYVVARWIFDWAANGEINAAGSEATPG